MDDKTLFWLAGLFEGEAYFARATPSEPLHPRIVLTMTDEDVIARVAILFEHSYTVIPPRKAHWSISYKFTLRSTPAVELMRQLYPLMGKRRQGQIDRALEGYIYNPHSSITYSKVTEEQVRAIKKRLAKGETAKSIAQDFPISHYAIWDIRSGKTWGHVSVDDEPTPISSALPEYPPPIFSEENVCHWFVGLLEGEGSFMSGPPSSPNEPRISVAMTDEDVIERASQFCQTTYQKLNVRNEHHKRVYRMFVRGKKAVELMKCVYPLMGKRRHQQIDRVLDNYVEIPHSRGMYNPSAKLSEGQAREIKKRLRDGETVSAIAEVFNVSISIVREIKFGRTWKHITL
jgi:hypothetical protein